jgi:tol-pal system protein YbgF
VALAEAETRDLRSARSLVEQGRTVTIGGAAGSDIDWIEPELARDDAWISDDEGIVDDEPDPRTRRIVLADAPSREPEVRVAPAPVSAFRAAPAVVPSPPARVVTASPAPTATPPRADEGAVAYRAALEAVRARRLDEAIDLFERFLARYPAHPYADNALYWQGEIHFVAGRLRDARTAYERIVRDHPSANKVSDALFRLGVCAQRLGESERARDYFRELRSRFPESPAARRVPEEAT